MPKCKKVESDNVFTEDFFSTLEGSELRQFTDEGVVLCPGCKTKHAIIFIDKHTFFVGELTE
jgi:hypothetical protein